jgi:chromate reductase, NAD(P)H dehydrogenase (quinone)
MEILALCGSLRAASSNRALLQAALQLVPDGLTVTLYSGIADLPHFSPDFEDAGQLPAKVRDLRETVAQADALLISCPEYMHCLPGSFKNALDWMVGCEKFPGKPVALFQATSRHEYVPALLRDVLKTMSADVIEDACLALPIATNRLDTEMILGSSDHAEMIRSRLTALRTSLEANQGPAGTPR